MINAASLLARWSRYPEASRCNPEGSDGYERVHETTTVQMKEDTMYKRVLVPVDGSGVAESILPYIREIASPPDLDVILLQVNGIIPPMAIEGTRNFGYDRIEARREQAEMYLGLLAAEIRISGARVHTRVRLGDAADEILAVARDEEVDLIAMATHGRTGPARLLWGSVAESVVRRAPVPVFLVRRTEEEVVRRHRDAAVVGAAWGSRE